MQECGYETVLTAMKLTSALMAVHNSEAVESQLRVELVKVEDRSSRWVVEVKIAPDLMEESSDLADGTEIISCRTPKGFRVDFVSPKPDDRNAYPHLKARAFVEDGTFDA